MSDLGEEADEMEIEETFMAFGTLKYLWVSRPSKIANVFFENDRDAREAVRCLDGTLVSFKLINLIALTNYRSTIYPTLSATI